MHDLKELESAERNSVLSDPTQFREFVVTRERHGATYQLEALLHLVFPEPFEPIVSAGKKKLLAEKFSALPGVGDAPNVDEKLAAIRAQLAPVFGPSFTFYRSNVRSIWDEEEGTWEPFVGWAERIYSAEGFDAMERDYKLQVADRMTAARDAVLGGQDEWPSLIREAFTARPNNLTSWRDCEPFVRWCEESPREARSALTTLWESPERSANTLAAFLGALPDGLIQAEGGRIAVGSLLLMGADASTFPPFRPDPVRRAYERLGRPSGDATGADRYREFLDVLDELRARLLARGVALSDRLDAQSLLWWVTSGDPPETWSDDEKAELVAFQKGTASAPTTESSADSPPTAPRRAWLMRGANIGGENFVPYFLADGFIAVGWDAPTPLAEGMTRAAIAEVLRDRFPDESAGTIRNWVGIDHRFVNLVEPGDLILTPDGPNLYIGRVSSNAEQTSRGEHTIVRRSVEWLNRDAPVQRSQVKVEFPSLYSKMRTLLTITDLKEDGATVAALAGLVPPPPPPPAEPTFPAATPALAERLFLPIAWLQEVVDALNEKRQLVFYGPPGTGKTFVAQALGEHVEETGGEYEVVQFHPSYSYENFFEGFDRAKERPAAHSVSSSRLAR